MNIYRIYQKWLLATTTSSEAYNNSLVESVFPRKAESVVEQYFAEYFEEKIISFESSRILSFLLFNQSVLTSLKPSWHWKIRWNEVPIKLSLKQSLFVRHFVSKIIRRKYGLREISDVEWAFRGLWHVRRTRNKIGSLRIP